MWSALDMPVEDEMGTHHDIHQVKAENRRMVLMPD